MVDQQGFHGIRVNSALFGIYNLSSGLYHQGVRKGSLPVGIDGFNEGIFIAGIENIICAGCLLLLQEL